MLYGLIRAIVRFALHLFYRVRVQMPSEEVTGPVIYVGNHPNGLIDPALIFVVTRRPVTFLAKAPLFKVPLIGQILKGLRALPVYRKQDDPRLMAQNEGTFDAATQALLANGALMIFPEGKSHSEPALATLKTGAARIAFSAARQGAPAKIVPVGLTYEEKHRFRSEVLIEVGAPIEASSSSDDERQAVLNLTEQIAEALKRVTLNLEKWEDLPLIRTAEELYMLKTGQLTRDADRSRRFARGVQIFRAEQRERFEAIRDELMSFGNQLQMIKANPSDLTIDYRLWGVVKFVIRNLTALVVGLPIFITGLLLFALPFAIGRAIASSPKLDPEDRATFRLIGSVVFSAAWILTLSGLAWHWLGLPWATATLLLSPFLALFSRYFYERRRAALWDARTFFVLGSRARLKKRLLKEGERLATAVEQIAEELRPRVAQA